MAEDIVSVAAPARLHLGFLDPSGRTGRRFGGIGLALAEPATVIELTHAARTEVTGPDAARAARHLARLTDALGLSGPYRLAIREIIPPQAGLGSGTQLALAAAVALRTLEGLPWDIGGDAARLGRGSRSGLGASFLRHGGLAVDGGKGPGEAPPPMIARLDFPEEWRAILVLEPGAEGFHGEEEIAAFAELPAFPCEATAEICRLVLMQALPSVAERNLAGFGAAITTIQRMVGGHFAPAQGGLFTSRRVARACEALAKAGAHGIGQSSWGPTGFAFAASEAEAETLVAAARAGGAAEGLDIRIVVARNGGATIRHHRAQAMADDL